MSKKCCCIGSRWPLFTPFLFQYKQNRFLLCRSYYDDQELGFDNATGKENLLVF